MDVYEEEFRTLTVSAQRSLATALSESGGDPNSLHVNHAESSLEEAAAVLASMELQLHGLGAGEKRPAEAKVKGYKADLARIRKEVQTTKLAIGRGAGNAERNELLSPETIKALEQRSQMVDSTKRLLQTTERLNESRRMAAETESVGASLLDDLSSQRATMGRTRNNLGTMDDVLSQGRGYIDSMSRRNWMNRMALNGLGSVALIACLIVIFSKFRGTGS